MLQRTVNNRIQCYLKTTSWLPTTIEARIAPVDEPAKIHRNYLFDIRPGSIYLGAVVAFRPDLTEERQIHSNYPGE